jgi:hypothetical protein
MRFVLGALVLLFNTLDNTTTFLCLRNPAEGFEVIEANPLARWLFDAVGLVQGLVFESIITLAAVAFLVLTQTLPTRLRLSLLAILILLPAWAVVNNLQVMAAIGAGL